MSDIKKELEELEARRRELLKQLPRKKAAARHKARLTSERVRRFTYDAAGPKAQRLWDEDVGGLALEVYPSGKKSFILRYRIFGRQRMLTLGDARLVPLAQARQEATEALLRVRKGRDPLLERRFDMNADTLSEVYLAFCHKPEFLKRSASYRRNIQSSWRNHIEGVLGHVPVTKVSGREVVALVDSIAERGTPGAAKAALSAIQAVLRFAKRRRLVEANVALDLGIEFDLKKRTRTLSDEELSILWAMGGLAGSAVRWMLCTGQRISEALSIEWRHVDGGVITIPQAITKARRQYRLPVTDLMRHLLAERKAAQHRFCRYIFSNGTRAVSAGYVRARMSDLEGVSPHVLRHHVITAISEASGRDAAARIVNHSIPGITSDYDHSDHLATKREALETWHNHLVQVLGLDLSERHSKAER